MILKIMLEKTGPCSFEEFDSGTMGMVNCGKEGKVKHSKGYLCKHHGLYALQGGGKKGMFVECRTPEGHIQTKELHTIPEYEEALEVAYELV